jgi:hypothetical protein
MEFDAIAAVAVGGTSFEKGKGLAPGHPDRRAGRRRAAQRTEPDGRHLGRPGRGHRIPGDLCADVRCAPRESCMSCTAIQPKFIDAAASAGSHPMSTVMKQPPSSPLLPLGIERIERSVEFAAGPGAKRCPPAAGTRSAVPRAEPGQRRFSHWRQHRERAAAGRAAVPAGIRRDARHPHGRPGSFGGRQRGHERVPGGHVDEVHGVDRAGGLRRLGCGLADRHCQWPADHVDPHPAFHRDLRNALDPPRHHLLVHEGRDDPRISGGVPRRWAAVTGWAFQSRCS